MDKKYIGKTVALTKDITEKLEIYRAKLSEELGFLPSLSDTIGYLLKKAQQEENESKQHE